VFQSLQQKQNSVVCRTALLATHKVCLTSLSVTNM